MITPTNQPTMSAFDTFIECVKVQKQKEAKQDIWKDSPFKDLRYLESNNVGIVGETFISSLCQQYNITASIDGSKTKQKGEKKGAGDGSIKTKSTEIKLSRRGTGKTSTFQHELGEMPWVADYMGFVDVAPTSIYLVIFPNFSEDHYKSSLNCAPYFPLKKIHQRKKTGAYKFDTTEKQNEKMIQLGYCIKIEATTTPEEVGAFIDKVIH